jgi:uncharacterized protein DUF3850
MNPMQVDHELKVWPPFYDMVDDGSKPFEIRKDDRDFKVGDLCLMKEYKPASHGFPGSFTGRSCVREIICVIKGGEFGVVPGYVILGIKEVG